MAVAPSCSTASAKGLAIISRFPNSKKPEEASGKNLVAGKPEELSGGRIVHDNIKTEPTKMSSLAPKPAEAASAISQMISTPQPSTELARPSSSNPTETTSTIQVNEVTSSEASSELASADAASSRQFVSALPSASGPARPRKSLSRELASLALSSPQQRPPARGPKTARRSSGLPPQPRRRGRSIDGQAAGLPGSGNESDEENVLTPPLLPARPGRLGGQAMLPADKLDAVEAKCDALNNKIKLMERKVVDRTELLTAEVRALRETMGTGGPSVASPTRVLRSRNGDGPATPASGTKRKRAEEAAPGPAPRGQQAKRERTTTWAGRTLRAGRAEERPARVTRKSTASVVVTKGRRSLNLLGKK
jgi:hypothetical protein